MNNPQRLTKNIARELLDREKLESSFANLRVASLAAAGFGIAVQSLQLLSLGALQFFSFNQVINDAVGIGGAFAALMALLYFNYQRMSRRIFALYGFLVTVSGLAIAILAALALNNLIRLTLRPAITAEIMLLLAASLLHLTYIIFIWVNHIRKMASSRKGMSAVSRSLRRKPATHMLCSGALMAAMFIGYYLSIMGQIYLYAHQYVFAKSGDSMFLVRYMNDQFVFVERKEGKAIVVPRLKVEMLLPVHLTYSLVDGVTIFKPTDEVLLSLFGRTDFRYFDSPHIAPN